MSEVHTVNGVVDSADLGRTYMHEHIFVLTTDVQQNYPDEWGSEDERVADAVAKLTALAAAGVRTIVDPTVIGLGRYIPRIQRVAAQVPSLNIVVATGCYTYHDVPFYFRHRGPVSGPSDPLALLFIRDITSGIGDTGVRAGLLKCSIDEPGMTDGVARVMRAVAVAHHATGVPVMVHTHPGSHTGLAVRRVLCDEGGVSPDRVVLSHSGDTVDADHLSALAEFGFVLGMDRFGLNTAMSFEDRADVVVELCRRGFASRMVLSHDAACYIDWIGPRVWPRLSSWHYLHISEEVLPYLLSRGVTSEQISMMLVDNPRRYFSSGPSADQVA